MNADIDDVCAYAGDEHGHTLIIEFRDGGSLEWHKIRMRRDLATDLVAQIANEMVTTT